MQNKVEKENAKKAEVTENLVTRLDETRSKLTVTESHHHDHVAHGSNGVLTHHNEDRRKVELAVEASQIAEIVPPTTASSPVKNKAK